MKARIGIYALIAPAVVLLGVFFLWPLIGLLAQGFVDAGRFSFSNFTYLLAQPATRYIIIYTYVFTLAETALALVLGYVVSYAMATFWSRYSGAIMAMLVLAFWTGMLIRTFAWMIILGKSGVIANILRLVGIEDPPALLYNTFGTTVGILNVALPYMVLMLYPAMKRVDLTLVRAARTLGARPIIAFLRVYVPATRSGIVAGVTLVYMFILGFYITPELLGSGSNMMISQLIAQQVNQVLNWNVAGALALLLMLGSGALIVVYVRQVNPRRAQDAS